MITSPGSNEYFNAISHLIGTILSLAALIVLVTFSALEGKAVHIIAFSIYGTSLFLSMLGSCLLHFFLLFDKYKRVFGVLDHTAIYILIAGTYTPFCLVTIRGGLGWTLFGIIWGLAIFCITLKAIFFAKIPPIVSNISYLLMGWLVFPFIGPIYQQLGFEASVWMAVGGICYSIGAVIFALAKPNPFPPFFGSHEIWHVAVLLGNASFFWVMLRYVLPLA
jgi:hemolysin III